MRRFALPILLAALLALAHAGQADAAARLRVVAAENFYGEVAREIGGDEVDVTSILSSPDADPHLFETSPSTARALADADIVILNGAGYDGWMARLLSATGPGKRRTVEVASLVGARDGDNPHLWYRPETLPAVAEAVSALLTEMDPADAPLYRANLAAFRERFARIRERIAGMKARLAGTGATATEPVFGYMIRALGFTDLNTAFQTAVMNGTEPSPRAVAGFEKSLSDGSVRILFYNRQVETPTTRRLIGIAKANGVAVVGVTETMPAGKTIAGWFSGQIEEIGNALGTQSN